MATVYSVIIICYVISSILFRNYKKEIRKELRKKEHPFLFMYGLVMLLEDKFLGKIKVIRNEKIIHTLKALTVKDKIDDILYLIKIKKYATCILLFLILICIGLCKSLSENLTLSQYLTELQRPTTGEGDASYDLNVIIGEKKQTFPVQIKVKEEEYTKDEIDEKMESAKEKLNEIILGENDAQDNITESLNLVTQIEDMEVSWEIQDPELIDYNGTIYPEKVKAEGVLTYIIATLYLGDIEKIIEIPLVIKPPTDEVLTIQDKIQNAIDTNNNLYESKISLPTVVDEEEIHFQSSVEKQSSIFLFLAFLSSVILFIVQDKELSNKVKKRNQQMMIDYPEIVSKLTLLSGAGLSITRAWDRIVSDYEKNKNNKMRFAYEEMRLTNIKMKNGSSEPMSYAEFGKRCNLQCYLKLGSLLEQNITKGTKGLKGLLDQEVRDAFEARKNHAKIRGEEASTKLLVPMVFMLVIVIVIIVVPSFLAMNI